MQGPGGRLDVEHAIAHGQLPQGGLDESQAALPGEARRRSLLRLPIHGDGVDPGDYGNSTLIYSVVGNQTGIMTEFLNSTLPIHVSYSISLERYIAGTGIVSSGSIVLSKGPDVIGETARTHFIFHHQGDIYDVQLLMWYLSRGSVA